MGSQIHHLWPRWPPPNVLARPKLNLTQGQPLVAKFSSMCRHFWESHERHGPKVRVYREKFNIGFFTQTFWGVPIHVWKPGKNVVPKSKCKIFHGRPVLDGYRSLTDFFRIGQNSANYNKIWKKYKSNKLFETIQSTSFIFDFFGIFYNFSRFFKKVPKFWRKKIHLHLIACTAKFC